MCWSFEASFVAGLFSWLVALFLLYRRAPGDVSNAIFGASFSSLQFVDAAFWYDAAANGLERCSPMNVSLSSWAVPGLLLWQLIASARCTVVPLPKWWKFLVLAFGVGAFWTFHDTCTALSGSGHLVWGKVEVGYPEALLFAILLLRPRCPEPKFWKFLVSPMTLVSLAVVAGLKYMEPEAFGSFWCALATVFSVVYFVKPLFHPKA
jgi:hypothetical protein